MGERKSQTVTVTSRHNIEVDTANFRNRAMVLSSVWGIGKKLGLASENDRTLVRDVLAQRLLRTSLYETSSFLKSAAAVLKSRFKSGFEEIRRFDLVNQRRQDTLDCLDAEIADFTSQHYGSEEERTRARTIELAINALVAQATPPTTRHNLVGNLRLSDNELADWAARWKPLLQQQ